MLRVLVWLGMLVAASAHAQPTFEEGAAAFDTANASGDLDHPDYQKAFEIWSALADTDPASRYHLGQMHWFGIGGADFDQYDAIVLIRSAAEQGYHLAQTFMGFLTENSDGVYVLKGDDRARAWYEKAAASGQCTAVRRLERAYRNGELGVAADAVAADAWRDRIEGCTDR